MKSDLNTLRAIPSGQISSVEVDYTSAVQEGATNSGSTIRVRLKKLPEGGLTNSLTLMAGYQPAYGLTQGGGLPMPSSCAEATSA